MTRSRFLLKVAASREVSQRPLRIVLWCALPFLFWLYFESPFTRPVPLEDVVPAYGSTILQIGRALWADGLGLVSHAAVSYLWAALIIAIDLMFGLALLRWMSRKTSCHLPPALRAASALALGCGFAGMAVFGLGAGHHLTRNAVVGITALMAVAGVGGLFKQQAWRWGFSFLAAFRPSRANRKLIIASTFLLLPAIAIHGFDLLLPVLEFDSTMYQMSAAKLYREQQAVAYHPGIRFNGQPQLPVLIYLRYWFLLESDSLLKLANLEFSFILLLTLVAVARQLRWRDSWFLGVLYLASMPIVCYLAKVEYADLALTAFSGLGIFLVLYQLRHPRLQLHVPAGLVFGFAVSCKHLGLMLFAAALVGYVAAAWVAGIGLRRLVRTSFLLVVLAGLSHGNAAASLSHAQGRVGSDDRAVHANIGLPKRTQLQSLGRRRLSSCGHAAGQEGPPGWVRNFPAPAADRRRIRCRSAGEVPEGLGSGVGFPHCCLHVVLPCLELYEYPASSLGSLGADTCHAFPHVDLSTPGG